MKKLHFTKSSSLPEFFRYPGFLLICEQFHPCHVSEMTTTGAKIHLDLPIELPSNFSLQLKRDGKVLRSCSLLWQNGSDANVIFNKVLF